ncbi:MAG: hypothetical protein AB1791_07515 [Chloroflexota bacterium]
MLSDIIGREFDWYALDKEGRFGLFATAGEGYVPENVVKHFAEHDGISATLESPNWGSLAVWQDYAKYSFFVFEWDLRGGGYVRRAVSQREPRPELRNRIAAMKSLVRLPYSFLEVSEIRSFEDDI